MTVEGEVIRVGIAAPTPAGRAGYAYLLESDPVVEVVISGAAPSDLAAEEAINIAVIAPHASPAASLGRSWAAMAAQMLPPEVALLIISAEPAIARMSLKIPIRALGFLSPDCSQAELLAAIHALHHGLSVAEPAMFISAAAGSSIQEQELDSDDPGLTPRELEVFQLLAHGLANKQIADVLHISPHTVKFHISSIYYKLNATNRAEAVTLGIQKGLLTL